MSAGGAIQSQSSAPESLDRWGFLAAIAFGNMARLISPPNWKIAAEM